MTSQRASSAMFHNTPRHNSWVHKPCLIFALNCQRHVLRLCALMSFLDLSQCHQGFKKKSPLSLSEAVRARHETGCLHVLTWPAVCCIVGFCLSGKSTVRKKWPPCQLITLALWNKTVKETSDIIHLNSKLSAVQWTLQGFLLLSGSIKVPSCGKTYYIS